MSGIQAARANQRSATQELHDQLLQFSDLIDGRGLEELSDVKNGEPTIQT